MKPAKVLYLDQNKWIELARALQEPNKHGVTYSVAESLVRAIETNMMIIPLSAANIYETQKINDVERRAILAQVQVSLSGGIVFRGHSAILYTQILHFLARLFDITVSSLEPYWFLSSNPLNYVGFSFESVHGDSVPLNLIDAINDSPAAVLHSYLMEVPEDVRRSGVEGFSAASNDLISQITQRSALVTDQSLETQRRAYGAHLLMEKIDLVLEIASKIGAPIRKFSDMPDGSWRALMDDVGLFYVERELVIRIEREGRDVNENDLRDVSSFSSAFCLADFVVGEKASINRARQAKLNERFSNVLCTSLEDLLPILPIH